MSTKPILFNSAMVCAILYGNKTETRRIAKSDKAPYSIGDVLYVRETWKYVGALEDHFLDGELIDTEELRGVQYKADNFTKWFEYEPRDDEFYLSHIYPSEKWKPSLHMPKELSRIFLKITDVHKEHLHDMTNDDALAEGAGGGEYFDETGNPCGVVYPIDEFIDIWNETISEKDMPIYGWEANPLVWVIKFKVAKIKDKAVFSQYE